jgi:hypothetical protein
LKPKDKLTVYADGCSLQVLKQPANQQLIQLGCESWTPTATEASEESHSRPSKQNGAAGVVIENDAFVTIADRVTAPSDKVEHTLQGGGKLNVRALEGCNLKLTKNTAEKINIKCKPKPPTLTPTPTRTKVPTRTPTKKPSGPDGRWSGKTHQGKSINFYVAGNQTSWNRFKIQFVVGPCLIELLAQGGGITNGQMHVGGKLPAPLLGSLDYYGTFESTSELEGTISAVGAGYPGCGTVTENGKWNAHWAAPIGGAVEPENALFENGTWRVTSISR